MYRGGFQFCHASLLRKRDIGLLPAIPGLLLILVIGVTFIKSCFTHLGSAVIPTEDVSMTVHKLQQDVDRLMLASRGFDSDVLQDSSAELQFQLALVSSNSSKPKGVMPGSGRFRGEITRGPEDGT